MHRVNQYTSDAMAEGTSCTAIERERDVVPGGGIGTTALCAKMKADHAVAMKAIMEQHRAQLEKITARGRTTARMHKLELARMKNELEKEAERRIRTDREESDKHYCTMSIGLIVARSN